MDYKVQKLEKNQAKLTITLNKEEWQAEIENAYNKHKNRYNITGFRPGKAPRKVIEKNYGEGVFFEDALSESFYKYYFEILQKEPSLEVVDAPSLNVLDISPEILVIEAELQLQPEVVVKKYTGFNVKSEPQKVTDEQVEFQVKKLLEQNVRFVESDKPLEKGNVANIDFVGSINGKPFEGGASDGYELEIGSHSFIDTFEDQLIGLKAGDKKDVTVSFPADYHVAELAGKPAVFAVTVNQVKVKEYPQLTDEFIGDVTEFNTIEEYKKDLKAGLEKQAVDTAYVQLQTKILDKVLENTEVEIPESMVDHEVEHSIGDFENRLMYQGLNLETYVNYLNTTVEDFKKSRRSDAEKNVKVRFALGHILTKENIKLEAKEIEEKIAQMAENAKKPLEEYKKLIDDHALSHIENDILMEKLLTFLVHNNQTK